MNDDVGSIYFGGGTPSILTETDLEKILNEIHKKFKISNHAEITIECNPDDVSLEKIEVWKKNSFNRVSLGIQSFIDSDLVLMNRSHNSKTAIDSIEKIINTCSQFKLNNIEIEFDLSLARGLGYYTGTIVEVSSPKDFSLGSIGGGGRYDDLVQKNNPKLSGFGISFGFDRIFLILEELNLFPNLLDSSKSFLFLNFGTDKISNFIDSVNQLRKDGIVCEIYPDDVKIKKQLDYANKKGIDFVVIIGDDELKKDIFKVKDMSKGEELTFTQIDSLAEKIKEIS